MSNRDPRERAIWAAVAIISKWRSDIGEVEVADGEVEDLIRRTIEGITDDQIAEAWRRAD
jgi:hypothetical protein